MTPSHHQHRDASPRGGATATFGALTFSARIALALSAFGVGEFTLGDHRTGANGLLPGVLTCAPLTGATLCLALSAFHLSASASPSAGYWFLNRFQWSKSKVGLSAAWRTSNTRVSRAGSPWSRVVVTTAVCRPSARSVGRS